VLTVVNPNTSARTVIADQEIPGTSLANTPTMRFDDGLLVPRGYQLELWCNRSPVANNSGFSQDSLVFIDGYNY